MILATNNKGKLKEIRKILSDYKIYSLKDKNIDIDVEEDKDSFLGNAEKKAIEIYEISHEETIADDSGLCMNCLNGFPGVMTHRFLGEDATDRMRNEYLINEVNKYDDRSAQVICNLVYYDGINEIIGKGILNGLPIFITEWAPTAGDNSGNVNLEIANMFTNFFDSYNISSIFWMPSNRENETNFAKNYISHTYTNNSYQKYLYSY